MNEIIYHTHKVELKNTGFTKPKIKHFGKKKHWKKGDGNLGGTVIRPDGQWVNDVQALPLETQNQYVETMDCWSWNTNVAVEIMLWAIFNERFVSSKRFSNVMGGGTPNGGSPQDGCETVRKDGLLAEEELLWTAEQNTWQKFSSPRPIPQKLITSAKKWLRKYNFAHDWVVYSGLFGKTKVAGGGNMQEAMWQALTQSILGCAVYAWPQADSNGMMTNPSYQFNHWSKIVGGIYKQYWIDYDSYLNCWRKLAWNYPFRYVKRYEITQADMARTDADYIANNMPGKNVKGDASNGIYFIWNGYKLPYPSMDELAKIADTYWKGDKSFITVAQDALDLIPEGNPMLFDNIKNTPPFFTPDKP